MRQEGRGMRTPLRILRVWTGHGYLRPWSYVNLVVQLGQDIFARAYRSGRSAAWLARLVRDQEVDGSNPFAPTTSKSCHHWFYAAFVASAATTFCVPMCTNSKPSPMRSAHSCRRVTSSLSFE